MKRIAALLLTISAAIGLTHAQQVPPSTELAAGLNALSLPFVSPPNVNSCFEMLGFLGGPARVEELSRLDATTQLYEDCSYSAGVPTGVDFPIKAGEGLLVRMTLGASVPTGALSHGVAACRPVDLAAGVNLIGVTQPAAGLGCFDLLASAGPGVLSTVERLDPETEAFEACAYREGGSTPEGFDFPIVAGEAYLVHAIAPLAGFDPNSCVATCGDGVVEAATEFCEPFGTNVCSAGETCSADCNTCLPIPAEAEVDMELTDAPLEGVVLVNGTFEMFIQMQQTEAPVLLYIERAGMTPESTGDVCFAPLGLGFEGGCSTSYVIATSGGPTNLVRFDVLGLGRSFAPGDLGINIWVDGIFVRQIPVTVVETQASASVRTLVNDFTAGATAMITTSPPTPNLPIRVETFRVDPGEGGDPDEFALSGGSLQIIKNGTVTQELITDATGGTFIEIAAGYGGQGTVALSFNGSDTAEFPLTNPRNECCETCGKCGDAQDVGFSSVHPYSGEKILSVTDLMIPGRGLDYRFTRTYRSQASHLRPLATGDFGADWAMSYSDDRLIADGANVIVHRDTLRTDTFRATGIAGLYASPAEFYEELTVNPDGDFELRDADGIVKTYASFGDPNIPGRLIRMEDRNGNYMTFVYSQLGGATRWNLIAVVDTMGRNILYRYYGVTDPNPGRRGRLREIEDFYTGSGLGGRDVRFDYDTEGNLISVQSPAVLNTPNGNDFPDGKTYLYDYVRSADIAAGVTGFNRQRLLHNLKAIAYPNEAAVASTLPPAVPREQVVYGTDPGDPTSFDRVLQYTIGGINDSGVAAGGTIQYDYRLLNVNASGVNDPFMEITINDRRGDEAVYVYSAYETLLEKRENTRLVPLRNGEPPAYVTTSVYNEDKVLLSETSPAGDVRNYSIDSGNPDRFQQGNLTLESRTAGPNGASQATLYSERTHEPIYQQVASITDSRGIDPAFVPSLPDGCPGRSRRDRYTTRFFYDYQEAPANQILPLLAARLGITQTEAQNRLDAAGVGLGLGDLNGDGLTAPVAAGNVVRREDPSASLFAGSEQATINGDTCQEIVTLHRYNAFGQLTSQVDPEGNVSVYGYFPEQDPDGNGTVANPALDGRTRDTVSGGYTSTQIVDVLAGAGRNNGLDPTPTSIILNYRYDDVGNMISETDGRGIRTDYYVNELNEVVRTTRAAAVPPTGSGVPAEPVDLVAFGFTHDVFRDANGNVVRREIQDFADTSNTGGTADYTYRFDILDQLVESNQEVAAGQMLTSRYRYDRNGNRTLELYPEGNASTFVFDERGLPFQTTRGARIPTTETLAAPAGPYNPRGGTPATSTRNYDANGNVIEIVDALDTDGSPDNNSTIAGSGDATLTVYDGFDREVRTIDPAGNTRDTVYDPAGNPVRVTLRGPIGGPTPTDRIGAGNVDLRVTEYVHDEMNRLVQKDQVLFLPSGAVPQRPVTPTDGPLTPGDGRVTTRYAFDRVSRPTFETEDDLDVHRTDHDGAGRVTREIDPEGNMVEYAWDDAHNLIETRETDVSQIAGIADEILLTTTFYDSLNRAQTLVDNLGRRVEYRHDSRDNLVGRADASGPLGSATIARRVFGGGSRTIDAINDFGNVVLYSFDGANRKIREDRLLTSTGTGAGGAGSFGVSLYGQKLPTQQPTVDTTQGGSDGRITRLFEWDGNSLRSATIDDQSNRTDYTYDNLNRQIAETWGTCDFTTPLPDHANCDDPPATTTRSTIYDRDDNVEQVIDQNGTEVDCQYDALNRNTACDASRSTSIGTNDTSLAVIGTSRNTFEWDGLSRPVRQTDDNDPSDPADDSTVVRLFDSLGRTVEERQQIGTAPEGQSPPVDAVVSSRFSGEQRRGALIYPDGRELSLTYDSLDRIDTIADAGAPGPIADYDYIGVGRVLERRHPLNGTRVSFLNDAGDAATGYDGLRRPVELRHLGAGNALIAGFGHEYDRAGNKLSERKLHDPTNAELYGYDSDYRVLEFDRGTLDAGGTAIATPSANGVQSRQWDLDGVGNWVTLETTLGGITRGEDRDHSAFNELKFFENTNFGNPNDSYTRDRDHDHNGNLVDPDLFGFDANSLLYEWDHKNRLRRIKIKSTGDIVALYAYDAVDRRIRRVVTNSGTLDGTTDFLYDGFKVIEEHDASGTLERQFVYGRELDEPVVLDRNLDASGGATGAGDQRLFYHQNTLGSVFALTDLSGATVEAYQYDIYGTQTVFMPGPNGTLDFGGDDFVQIGGTSAVDNPYLFTGRRFDAESDLYYYRMRYLDPEQGRFLSRDPLGYADGPNTYQYVSSSPTNEVDPLGLLGNCCCPGGSWDYTSVWSFGLGALVDFQQTYADLKCRNNPNTASVRINYLGVGLVAGFSVSPPAAPTVGALLGAECLNDALGFSTTVTTEVNAGIFGAGFNAGWMTVDVLRSPALYFFGGASLGWSPAKLGKSATLPVRATGGGAHVFGRRSACPAGECNPMLPQPGVNPPPQPPEPKGGGNGPKPWTRNDDDDWLRTWQRELDREREQGLNPY